MSVFVCCFLCVQAWMCPEMQNVHCQKPFSQLQHIRPFTDGSQIQNGQSYFKPLILITVTHRNDWSALRLSTQTKPSAEYKQLLYFVPDAAFKSCYTTHCIS